MKKLLSVIVLVCALASEARGQRSCKTGIPCGKTCIAANRTCRIQNTKPTDSATREDIKSTTPARDTSAKVTTQSQDTSATQARVWVNTKSRVYHCPGSRYYGQTARGTYLSEKSALEQGYRAAYGNKCSP